VTNAAVAGTLYGSNSSTDQVGTLTRTIPTSGLDGGDGSADDAKNGHKDKAGWLVAAGIRNLATTSETDEIRKEKRGKRVLSRRVNY
jgi:hypothetical protein